MSLQKTLASGEIQETTTHYGLNIIDIYNTDDFLTTQYQKLVLGENLNRPDVCSG